MFSASRLTLVSFIGIVSFSLMACGSDPSDIAPTVCNDGTCLPPTDTDTSTGTGKATGTDTGTTATIETKSVTSTDTGTGVSVPPTCRADGSPNAPGLGVPVRGAYIELGTWHIPDAQGVQWIANLKVDGGNVTGYIAKLDEASMDWSPSVGRITGIATENCVAWESSVSGAPKVVATGIVYENGTATLKTANGTPKIWATNDYTQIKGEKFAQ